MKKKISQSAFSSMFSHLKYNLTQKKAKEIAIKVAGTAASLQREDKDCFSLTIGMVSFEIFYSYEYSCLGVKIYVSNGMSSNIELFFDCETLEENKAVEELASNAKERYYFSEWVAGSGPDICKQQIDKAWERREQI